MDKPTLIKDLTGKVYGCSTVIGENTKAKGYRGECTWHCQCECGKIEVRTGAKLKEGRFPKTCPHESKARYRVDTITADKIKEVIDLVTPTSDIFDILRKGRMSQNSFFLALKKDAELSAFYDACRKIRIEELLETCVTEVDQASNKLDLEKAKIKLHHYQWKAEKLIPEAYGNKVQIDVNKTVDIRGAIEEAKTRAGIVEATYRTVVAEEIRKELPTPKPTTEPEPLSADSSEINFAEIYQRSVRPSEDDLLG